MKHLKIFENMNSINEDFLLNIVKNGFRNCKPEIIKIAVDKGLDITKHKKTIAKYLFENLHLDGLVLLGDEFKEMVDFIKNNLSNLNVYGNYGDGDIILGKEKNNIILILDNHYKPPILFVSHLIELKIRNYGSVFLYDGDLGSVNYNLLNHKSHNKNRSGADSWKSSFEKFMGGLVGKFYNLDTYGVSTKNKMGDYDITGNPSWEKINESYSNYMVDNFYNYYGNIIFITKIILWGHDEYQITYLDKDGKEYKVLIPMKEIEEDFIDTDQSFVIEPVKKIATIIQNKKPKRFNLVYYIGKKKVETIKWDLNNQQANGLRSLYRTFPQYKTGEIKKEVV